MKKAGTSTILVVDDEPDLAEMMSFCLTQQGYAVATAESGERAVDLARATRFDLAICDLTMPGWDGIQTARALRDLTPDLQVIIVTGYASEEARSAIRNGVAEAWLPKPFTVKELQDSISQVLRPAN
jgi:CheY-like chemotaxis protein